MPPQPAQHGNALPAYNFDQINQADSDCSFWRRTEPL